MMEQIFNYKQEAAELIQQFYMPATASDTDYISKSLTVLYVELCEVIPEQNFKEYDLYEVLKSLGYKKFLAKEGFEYRFKPIGQ